MYVKKLDLNIFEQAKAASRIRTLAFHFSNDYDNLLRRERDKDRSADAVAEPVENGTPSTTWGVFSDDSLIAVASAIDFSIRYEKQDVKMSGIAGVATLPEYRRKGAIRLLLGNILQAERDRGCIFSYLHPFSYAYYRQFGYGYGSSRTRTTIPIRYFQDLGRHGSVRLMDPGNIQVIKDIYADFISDINGPVDRGGDKWNSLVSGDPFARGSYPYVWYNDSGLPQAYLIMLDRENVMPSGKRKLIIQDWGCANLPALKGILAFLGSFSSEYEAAEIVLPAYIRPEMLFGELISLDRKEESFGQVRLLNVEAALYKLLKPHYLPDLAFRIQVIDSFLPVNNGIYTVNAKTGGNAITFSPDLRGGYDIKIDISDLSSLLYGSIGLSELAAADKVQLSDELADKTREYLEIYFRKRENSMFDHF